MLITYVRDKNGQRVGAVVALLKEGNTIGLGWSKCNKQDKFDKERAKAIAKARAAFANADLPYGTNSVMPSCMTESVNKMVRRANKYFKEAVC